MTFLCNFFYETKEGRKEGKDERRAGSRRKREMG